MGAAFKSRVHLHCVLEEERDVVEDVSKAFLSSRLTGVLPGSDWVQEFSTLGRLGEKA